MRGRMVVLLLVGALAGAGACGGDDDDVPGGDGGTVDGTTIDAASAPDAVPAPTLAEICDVPDGLFVQFVQKLLACHPEFQVFLGSVPTGTTISLACDGSFQPFFDDGSILLGDRATLDACRDYVESATCATLEFDAPGPCDALFVGTIAAGELCDTDDQCVGNAFCDKSGGPGCGACAPRKADGASCTDGTECQGRRCASDGTCRAFGVASAPCLDRDDCLGDLRCDASGQCVVAPAWAVGTPCGDLLDCDPITGDLLCDPGTALCSAYREIGQSCGGANGYCRLFEYQSCAPNGMGGGTCVAAQTVADGQDCGLFQGLQCMDGSRCVDHDLDPMTTERCVKTLGIGAACDAANSFCDVFMECVADQCQYGEYTGLCPAP